MPRQRFVLSTLSTFFALTCAFTLGSGCELEQVGDPCVPEEEFREQFNGFSATEAYIESRSFQCATRVCLVNHFQGRVSCPYGQSVEDLDLPGDDPRRCRVPGTSGQREEDRVSVPVNAWLSNRGADDAVYCSCRCAGPEPAARYCECPSGYACTELVPELGLGRGQLAGSYCIKEGTRYAPGHPLDCRDDPAGLACPEPYAVNP